MKARQQVMINESCAQRQPFTRFPRDRKTNAHGHTKETESSTEVGFLQITYGQARSAEGIDKSSSNANNSKASEQHSIGPRRELQTRNAYNTVLRSPSFSLPLHRFIIRVPREVRGLCKPVRRGRVKLGILAGMSPIAQPPVPSLSISK